MRYEIHITVNATDIDRFRSDCHSIGIKPIVIETENKYCFEKQVMTSSTHDSYDDLFRIVNDLQLKGYTILRKKVEKQPEKNEFGVGIKHKSSLYYESHLRLKLPNDYDLKPLKGKIDNKWHLSKNLFKRDDFYYYQMLTYREYELDLESFEYNINYMKSILDSEGVIYDKIEIEECIYDTNINLDDSWLIK